MSSEGSKDIKRWNPETARKGPGTPAVTHKPVSRGAVVRPFTYRDGQPGEGTPAGRESTDSRKQHYAHKDQEQQRRGLGSQPYPTKR